LFLDVFDGLNIGIYLPHRALVMNGYAKTDLDGYADMTVEFDIFETIKFEEDSSKTPTFPNWKSNLISQIIKQGALYKV